MGIVISVYQRSEVRSQNNGDFKDVSHGYIITFPSSPSSPETSTLTSKNFFTTHIFVKRCFVISDVVKDDFPFESAKKGTTWSASLFSTAALPDRKLTSSSAASFPTSSAFLPIFPRDEKPATEVAVFLNSLTRKKNVPLPIHGTDRHSISAFKELEF